MIRIGSNHTNNNNNNNNERYNHNWIVIGSSILTATVTTSIFMVWYKYHDYRNNKRNTISNENDTNNNNTNTELIYLDYNGTTPIYQYVYNAMIPYFTTYYGNPSSIHIGGDIPKYSMNYSRYQILYYLFKCIHVEKPIHPTTNSTSTNNSCSNNSSKRCEEEPSYNTTTKSTTTITPLSSCIFTSCGTEADNMMISFAVQLYNIRQQQQQQQQQTNTTNTNTTKVLLLPPHIITSNIEHPAIDICLKYYEQQNLCIVSRIVVQSNGRLLVSDVISAIQSNTILITIMLANNETGVLQPIREISEYCHEHYNNQILIGTDAAQATGKINLSIHELGYPDMISIVGHKFGVPKGIGCLYMNPNCISDNERKQLVPLLLGGGQEYNLRGGTSNVPYIVGLGIAAEHVGKELYNNQQHMECMRTRFIQKITNLLGISNILVHGPTDPNQRLPNTISIGFSGNISSHILLQDLRTVVAASAGTTCHSTNDGHQTVISPVLLAMNIPEMWARSTIRISLGPYTTSDEIDRAVVHIAKAVQRQWDNQKKINK